MRLAAISVLLLFASHSFAQTDTSAVDSTVEESTFIPNFTVTADALENEMQSQDVNGLLQSSRDVYTSMVGYNLSPARFRIRGYGSENFTVMLNGVPMNDPESGWTIWSTWGGLNDITRYPTTRTGINSSAYTFGGVGGFSNITFRASDIRKGTRFSYAITNRTYRHRAMLTHSSGMMSNGWAVTASMSRRWSQEGYVEGTWYDGAGYFLAVEKRLNDKHSINVAGFGAPILQGRQGIALQEAYDLTGNNYYNPYWGYQDGMKRNARVRNNHKPMILLTHYWTINNKSKLPTTAQQA